MHASRRHVEPGRCSGDLTLLHTVGSLAACRRCEARVRACVGASVKMLGHHHRQHRYTCSARGAPLLRGYGRRRGACRSKRVEGSRWRCRAPHRIGFFNRTTRPTVNAMDRPEDGAAAIGVGAPHAVGRQDILRQPSQPHDPVGAPRPCWRSAAARPSGMQLATTSPERRD